MDNGAFDGQPALNNGGVAISMFAQSPTAFTMSVSNVIVAPLVPNTSFSTGENAPLTISKPGVLGSALDVYGTNLTATLLAGPANGTVNLSTNGGFTYTPATNFFGTDGFTFQASDKLNNFGPVNVTITVLQITNMITVTVNNTNRLYGSTNPVFTVSYSGFVNGDNSSILSGSPVLTTSATTNSPTGTYTITNTIGTLSASSYTFSFTNGTLTVTPASLKVTASNTNRLYGATNPVFAASYSGFVNGDTTGVLSGAPSLATSATTNSPAGNYTITNTIGSLNATNYTFSFTNGALTINPAALTISASNLSKAYGQAVSFAGTEFSTSGLLNHDSVTGASLSSTGAVAGAGVNGSPYSITVTNATGTGLTNYEVSYVNGTLTVGPAVLAAGANNTNRLYGANNPVFTVTYNGFLNGDNAGVFSGAPSLTTGATTNSPKGNYTITNNIGTLSAANYSFSFTNGTLTINPAALTISASNQSKAYGQAVSFAGTEFSASGLLNHDAVTSASLSSAGAAAGAGVNGSPYSITVTNATGTGFTNYAISYVNGQLTVTPVTLTVKANNTNRIYGANNPAFTAAFNGFVNNDNLSVLSGSPSLTTTATTASPVAGYPIVATNGNLSAANYAFSFVNGTLNVTAAPMPLIFTVGLTNRVITVTWSSVTGSTYGLQSSTNLTGTNWSNILPTVTATGPTTSQTNAVGNLPQQFYRVTLVPNP